MASGEDARDILLSFTYIAYLSAYSALWSLYCSIYIVDRRSLTSYRGKSDDHAEIHNPSARLHRTNDLHPNHRDRKLTFVLGLFDNSIQIHIKSCTFNGALLRGSMLDPIEFPTREQLVQGFLMRTSSRKSASKRARMPKLYALEYKRVSR